ncbi:type IV pilus biogenesis protein PilP [Salmonella enterica subsp. enterica]|nr:type IV pilus biogenesis protein PilP [Salmonella enterica subsp. enterica serovar Virchow]
MRKKTNLPRLMLACGLLWCGAAIASEASDSKPTTAAGTPPVSAPALPAPSPLSHGSRMTLEKLEQLQTETLLYEAQLNRDKALRELLTTPDTTSAPQANTPAQNAKAAPEKDDSAQEADPLPRVRSISGNGTQLSALLRLADGSMVQIQSGQRIPGTGVTVKAISARNVQVYTPGKNNSEQILPFDN